MSSIPLADAFELRPAARRTAAVRGVLGGALLAALAAAYLLAPGHDVAGAVAAGARGNVVVLDVSGSIADDRAARLIRRQLAAEVRASGPDGRIGLVLFSDSAMEALPPIAPAQQLLRFRRFFVPLPKSRVAAQGASGSSAGYPKSPWNQLVGGTAIASGLAEALDDLHRAGMSGGHVLLISDLLDSPADRARLARVLRRYEREPQVDLQVRVLPAQVSRPLGLYRRALGSGAVLPAGAAPAPPVRAGHGRPLSLWLLGAAALAAVALAAQELLASPLRWRRSAEVPT